MKNKIFLIKILQKIKFIHFKIKCFKFKDSKYSRQLLVLSFTYFTVLKQEVQVPSPTKIKKDNTQEDDPQLEQSQIKVQSEQQNNSLLSTEPSTQQQSIVSQIDVAQNTDSSEKDQQNQNGESHVKQLKDSETETQQYEYHEQKNIGQNGEQQNQSEDKNEKEEIEESKQNGDTVNENQMNNQEQYNEQQFQIEVITTKIYFYQQITQHYLWKCRDFWESAICDSAFEELKSCSYMKKGEQLKESQLREKNICFGQLISLLQNMLLFEIDKKEIRYLLQKFSKLFYLSEEQIKSLNVKYKFQLNTIQFI